MLTLISRNAYTCFFPRPQIYRIDHYLAKNMALPQCGLGIHGLHLAGSLRESPRDCGAGLILGLAGRLQNCFLSYAGCDFCPAYLRSWHRFRVSMLLVNMALVSVASTRRFFLGSIGRTVALRQFLAVVRAFNFQVQF